MSDISCAVVYKFSLQLFKIYPGYKYLTKVVINISQTDTFKRAKYNYVCKFVNTAKCETADWSSETP
jgi:hypothetical protein